MFALPALVAAATLANPAQEAPVCKLADCTERQAAVIEKSRQVLAKEIGEYEAAKQAFLEAKRSQSNVGKEATKQLQFEMAVELRDVIMAKRFLLERVSYILTPEQKAKLIDFSRRHGKHGYNTLRAQPEKKISPRTRKKVREMRKERRSEGMARR